MHPTATSILERLRLAARPRERLAAAAIALLAGLVVFTIASEVFPYHSSNHDEGVYLQQAALFLEGQLQLYPGELGDSVRPWFFVDAGDRLYPKYQPLPAAFYALSMAAFGEPRVTLAAVAAGNAALVYVLGSTAFDRRVGLLAAVGFAVAPMTLLTSSVFLPYAPTTLFNLAFAASYLRCRRTGGLTTAALAGGAIGVAFLTRPYTAVLFAAPFLVHALWEVTTAVRAGGLRPLPAPVRRQTVTAIVGFAFVALALAYNAAVTGSPLVFPYEAFAPLDGPGFGRREILSHSIEYTPEVALRANGYVLWYLLTRWVPAGAIGTALAVVGLVAGTRRWAVLPGDGTARTLLAGLFVSVPLGNLFFWGNYNVLATMSDPADGLLGQFGPFYHFDLLAPVAIFGAAGAVACWRRLLPVLERRVGDSSGGGRRPSVGRVLAGALLVGSLLAIGAGNVALVAGPLERNAAHTATYEDAYAPFEADARELDDALVFLPTPYGDWLNHPFQYLRNEPGFDGSPLYVMDRGPASDFAAIDASPERRHYRYTYRGEWTARPQDRQIDPLLEPLALRSGERLVGETVVGVPERVSHATVRLEADGGYVTRTVDEPGERLALEWSLDGDGASLEAVDGVALEASDAEPVAIGETDEVVVLVRLAQPEGGTLTYRQAVTVRTASGGDGADEFVEAVWPPERTVCLLVDDCGREGTYLPDRPDDPVDGVSFETRLEEAESSREAAGRVRSRRPNSVTAE